MFWRWCKPYSHMNTSKTLRASVIKCMEFSYSWNQLNLASFCNCGLQMSHWPSRDDRWLNMEEWWNNYRQRKAEVLRKPVQLPLTEPQIPHEMSRERSQAFPVRNRRPRGHVSLRTRTLVKNGMIVKVSRMSDVVRWRGVVFTHYWRFTFQCTPLDLGSSNASTTFSSRLRKASCL
jgi:hypothetical protein